MSNRWCHFGIQLDKSRADDNRFGFRYVKANLVHTEKPHWTYEDLCVNFVEYCIEKAEAVRLDSCFYKNSNILCIKESRNVIHFFVREDHALFPLACLVYNIFEGCNIFGQHHENERALNLLLSYNLLRTIYTAYERHHINLA